MLDLYEQCASAPALRAPRERRRAGDKEGLTDATSTAFSPAPPTPRRRSCCRRRSPTAWASSATWRRTASPCSPSTPTRAPSACARVSPPASSAPTRRGTSRPSSSSSRASAGGCRSAPSSSPPTTSRSGRSRARPSGWRRGTSSPSRAGTRWRGSTTSAEQMEAAWRCGVDTPKTVFVDAAADLDRAAEEIGFPAILKPVESLAFKQRFHRHVLEIHEPRGARRGLRHGRRLRHAHVPGDRPRRRRRALHGGFVPGRGVAPDGRLHGPQAAPAPAALRCLPDGRERLGRRPRRGRRPPAQGARLLGRQPGRVQASRRRRAVLPHGGQRAPLDVALAGHGLRRQPLARRLRRRDRPARTPRRGRWTARAGR